MNILEVNLGIITVAHCDKTLYKVMKYIGTSDIAYNQPQNLPYPTENPWG